MKAWVSVERMRSADFFQQFHTGHSYRKHVFGLQCFKNQHAEYDRQTNLPDFRFFTDDLHTHIYLWKCRIVVLHQSILNKSPSLSWAGMECAQSALSSFTNSILSRGF